MGLPSPYEDWLVAITGAPLPREERATCHDCVMCAPDAPGGTFHPVTRCCTYVPRIPNFMLGRILADTDPAAEEGRATVLRRLARGQGLSPLGLEVVGDDQAAYEKVIEEQSFGRSEDLRCPHHLSDGRCGIWKHRNGICATWFCRHEDGALGERFWEATQRMLTEVERAVGYWVARRVRFPAGATDEQAADEALFACDWGPWIGREEDFFLACAREFAALSWPRIRQIGQRHLRTLIETVADRAAERTAPVPIRLQSNREAWHGELPGGRVLAYSAIDPLVVPAELLEVLEAFDGRRVPDVLAELAEGGVEVDADLLRALRAFEVLVPSEG